MDTGLIEMPKPASALLPEGQVTPEPSLEKRTRRRFTSDYKLRMIAEADTCKHGELGALLRREQLYSNQLAVWRREYGKRGVEGLSKSMPGPVTSRTPEQRRYEQLRQENGRLKRTKERGQFSKERGQFSYCDIPTTGVD